MAKGLTEDHRLFRAALAHDGLSKVKYAKRIRKSPQAINRALRDKEFSPELRERLLKYAKAVLKREENRRAA